MNLSSYYRRALFFFLFFFFVVVIIKVCTAGPLFRGVTDKRMNYVALYPLGTAFRGLSEGWWGLARVGKDWHGFAGVNAGFQQVSKGFQGFLRGSKRFFRGGGWGFARVDGGFQQVFRGSKGFQDLSKGWWRLFRSLSGLMRVSKGF